MNHSYRALFFSTAFVALFSACDNGAGTGGSDDGSGGASSTSVNPTSTSSGMGNTTTGNTMSTTSTGSDVCTPNSEDPFCNGAMSCACNAMPGGMPPEAACPNAAGNVCTPGHNQCGCDLPMDTDYVMPDANCAGFVDGDIWQDSSGLYPAGAASANPNQNGQVVVKFGTVFQPGEQSYYNGFVLSDKSLNWNLANNMLDHCSGQFSEDCKSISIDCWEGGATTPYLQVTLDNVVHQ